MAMARFYPYANSMSSPMLNTPILVSTTDCYAVTWGGFPNDDYIQTKDSQTGTYLGIEENTFLYRI
jgi:hypothetical protein